MRNIVIFMLIIGLFGCNERNHKFLNRVNIKKLFTYEGYKDSNLVFFKQNDVLSLCGSGVAYQVIALSDDNKIYEKFDGQPLYAYNVMALLKIFKLNRILNLDELQKTKPIINNIKPDNLTTEGSFMQMNYMAEVVKNVESQITKNNTPKLMTILPQKDISGWRFVYVSHNGMACVTPDGEIVAYNGHCQEMFYTTQAWNKTKIPAIEKIKTNGKKHYLSFEKGDQVDIALTLIGKTAVEIMEKLGLSYEKTTLTEDNYDALQRTIPPQFWWQKAIMLTLTLGVQILNAGILTGSFTSKENWKNIIGPQLGVTAAQSVIIDGSQAMRMHFAPKTLRTAEYCSHQVDAYEMYTHVAPLIEKQRNLQTGLAKAVRLIIKHNQQIEALEEKVGIHDDKLIELEERITKLEQGWTSARGKKIQKK